MLQNFMKEIKLFSNLCVIFCVSQSLIVEKSSSSFRYNNKRLTLKADNDSLYELAQAKIKRPLVIAL